MPQGVPGHTLQFEGLHCRNKDPRVEVPLIPFLISAIIFGACQFADAAPGGAGKADLTTNLHVIDSSSPPVVVGEVVGFHEPAAVYVALSPSLANANPPLVVSLSLCYPINSPCAPLRGTANLYYIDAACTTTPYFTVPVGVFTPTGVIATSTGGAATTYQIYIPGAVASSTGILFSAVRDTTSDQSCHTTGNTDYAVQAVQTPYSIVLTPPFKMKNQ